MELFLKGKYDAQRRAADAAFVLFFVCAVALLIWKVPYGFHFFDETFYYSTAYRLMQGDIFLVDDWNVCQFSLMLLYPIVKLSCLLHGGTEGLILTARYVFVFFHALNALIIYLLLRRKSAFQALCAVAVYLPFSRWWVQAFSYYQMALDFTLLSAAMLAVMKDSRRGLPLSGFLFALAVLACPYLIFFYGLYTLLCVILAVSRKQECSLFRLRNWLLFSAGCATAAFLFLLFALSRSKASELIASVSYMLNDQSHNIGDTGKKLLSFIPSAFKATQRTDLPLIAAAVLILADKNRKKRKGLYTLVTAVLCLMAQLCRYKGALASGILARDSCMMRPICIAGFVSYMLCEKKDREILRFLYLGGLILLVCMYLMSDLQYDIYSTPMTISAMAGACFIAQLASELLRESGERKALRYTAAALALSMVASLVGVELSYRKNHCFCEPCGTGLMYSTIQYGIGKGEKTAEVVEAYEFEGLWDATEKVRNADGDYVLYFSADNWPYLEDSKKCAAFSTWLQPRSSLAEAERLLSYWEIHPERKPDAIFVSKTMRDPARVIELINIENFPVEENERGYVLLRPAAEEE